MPCTPVVMRPRRPSCSRPAHRRAPALARTHRATRHRAHGTPARAHHARRAPHQAACHLFPAASQHPAAPNISPWCRARKGARTAWRAAGMPSWPATACADAHAPHATHTSPANPYTHMLAAHHPWLLGPRVAYRRARVRPAPSACPFPSRTRPNPTAARSATPADPWNQATPRAVPTARPRRCIPNPSLETRPYPNGSGRRRGTHLVWR